MRKVTFVVIAGVFGSRMGPDLQCFVALFVLFWFFNFHLTAHPFDEISSRHRVLHHMETWALIVAWCTMWMGLIFYLGNEFGRINRDWMVVFTISIIVMNVLYSTVVLTLFFKEYVREKVEAHKAKEHDKLAHKLAAHMYHQTQIQANMMSNEQAESRHSLDPRRVGRNSAGGSILGDKLKAAGMGAGKAGAAPKDLLADSAASILKFQNTKLSKTKSTRQARRMQKMLTKRQMTKQQMEDMDRMLIGQRALESVSETIRSKGEKLAKIKAEHVYQKGRLKRRIKVRMLQRKMGVTLKESASGPSSLFGKILSRNRNKIAKRIKVLSSLNASMHKMRHEKLHTSYLRVKLWGMPTGINFKKSRDGYALEISSVKKGNSMCPAEGRSVLKMGDILIDVNGKDVRGLLASEAKSAYRSELREQSNRSMSEDPPMWYLIFRRGTEGENDDMHSTTELANRCDVIDRLTNAESLEQQEEALRARNNVTSGDTTESEEMNANDARNSINDVNMARDLRRSKSSSFSQKVVPSVKKYISEKQMTKEHIQANSVSGKQDSTPLTAGAISSYKASWEDKIGEVLCATRIDPDTGKIIDTEKRKRKLADVPAMLKRYKGKESRLLINYMKKYKVPRDESRKIMAM